jgi:serine/threonine protein phosphatase PrpC
MVEDSKILEIVLREKEPKDLCQQLVNAANDEGGMDNITALAVVL